MSTAVFLFLIGMEQMLLLYFPSAETKYQTLNATMLSLTSLFIGVFLLFKFFNRPNLIVAAPRELNIRRFIPLLVFSIGLIFLNIKSMEIYRMYIPKNSSDIIPSIEILCQRWLSGKNPYSYGALSSLYYDTPAGYLPAHWFPYTVAEHFHFDYRIVTFCIWAIASLVLLLRSMKLRNLNMQLLAPALIIGTYYFFVLKNSGVIGITVEVMVAAYYMLLVVGINQKNSLITGLLMSLCLLSHYYIALWLPLWAFVILASGNRKAFITTSVWLTFFVSIGYIIPFLSKDWGAFYASYVNNYEIVPFYEWQRLNPNTGLPWHMTNGTGFAHLFFLHYRNTNLKEGYLLLKKIMLLGSLGTLLVLAVFYWVNRLKVNYRIFLMASFKIYMTVFLAFVVIPYSYLMITTIFLSVAVFIEQARYDTT